MLGPWAAVPAKTAEGCPSSRCQDNSYVKRAVGTLATTATYTDPTKPSALEFLTLATKHICSTTKYNATNIQWPASTGPHLKPSLFSWHKFPVMSSSYLTFHFIILFYPGTASITEDRAQKRRWTLASCVQVHLKSWVQAQGTLQHEGRELRMVHRDAWVGREQEDGVEKERKWFQRQCI